MTSNEEEDKDNKKEEKGDNKKGEGTEMKDSLLHERRGEVVNVKYKHQLPCYSSFTYLCKIGFILVSIVISVTFAAKIGKHSLLGRKIYAVKGGQVKLKSNLLSGK